ncbi:hypothetical protein [Chelativorans sp.]|uniref:hypothetical protein n=1 Tax=Chelativorans sp. TaxID=2203393 RepID=UPI002811948D|nr:hypothetical protein [Chelativorans sp.]
MRKTLLIASAFAILSAGSAFAQSSAPRPLQAVDTIRLSSQNAAPESLAPQSVQTPVESPRVTQRHPGYSAADEFGPSEENAPPKAYAAGQAAGQVDTTAVTSGVNVVNRRAGYSAAGDIQLSDN